MNMVQGNDNNVKPDAEKFCAMHDTMLSVYANQCIADDKHMKFNVKQKELISHSIPSMRAFRGSQVAPILRY